VLLYRQVIDVERGLRVFRGDLSDPCRRARLEPVEKQIGQEKNIPGDAAQESDRDQWRSETRQRIGGRQTDTSTTNKRSYCRGWESPQTVPSCYRQADRAAP
jgi:hypothetical protein